MAIQAQLYSENFGWGGQDLVMENGGCGFDTLCLLPQQQQQQQQQHLMQFDQFQKDHTFLVGSSLHFLPRNNVNHDHQSTLCRRLFLPILRSKDWKLSTSSIYREAAISVLVKKYNPRLSKNKKSETRTMELQNFLKRLESESQTWQRIAKENEAMVASLNSTIGRLRESPARRCCENRQDMEKTSETKEEKLKLQLTSL
ncbi:hypothetical protein Sango_0542100 [Sesamum angolense]|uniref:Uncharacterized protein n=1 Tax=Sesamum angolense TaxID=2727404 RepID=A0AAE1X577_9LAMI|nr:hypothetical protein Sango_0542100 [Sesamum angolense]